MSSSSLERQKNKASQNRIFFFESAPHRSKKRINCAGDKPKEVTTLLSLPNEILQQIADEICPDGIESFALCCKAAHGLAQNAISQHNSYKKRFSRGCLQWASDLHLRGQFGLSIILRDPRSVPYIKELLITRRDYSDKFGPPLTQSQLTGSVGLSTSDLEWRGFFDASTCCHIPEHDVDHWQDMLDSADEASVTSMLLAQLPNLQRVSFCTVYDNVPIVQMVSSIAKKGDGHASQGSSIGPLSRLTHAELHNVDRDHDPAGLYESFVLLPSIHHLVILDFSGEHRVTFDHWPANPTISNLRHLEMRMDGLAVGAFIELLRRLPSLETFSYEYTRNDRSRNGLGIYVRLLELHLGHSLHHLILIANRRSLTVLTWVHGGHAESFSRFEKLETIEIQMEMLIRYIYGRLVAPRLVDILPPSLKELRFADIDCATTLEGKSGDMTRLVEGMFKGLRGLKQSRLPSLETIILSDSNGIVWPLHEQILKDCEITGIFLYFGNVRTGPKGPARFCTSCIAEAEGVISRAKFR